MGPGEARQIVVASLDEVLGLLDNPTHRAVLTSADGDATLEQLELDSLGLVDLSLRISERIGADVEVADLTRAGTLSGLVALVIERAG